VTARLRGALQKAVLPTFVVVGLAVVLLLSLKSPPFALLAAVGLVYLTLVGVWGFAQAGTATVTLAFFMAPMDSVRPVPGLAFVSAADILWLVGFITLAPTLLARRFAVPIGFLMPLMAFLCVALLASAGNPNPLSTFSQLVRLVVGALTLPIVIGWWKPSEKIVVRLATAYVLGSAVSGVVGLSRYHGDRIMGLTNHPNIFSLCAVLAVAIVPFLESRVDRTWRLILLATVPINVLGIWWSGSRTSLLALLFVVILYPLLKRSVMSMLTVAGVGVVGMFVLASFADAVDETSALGRLLGRGTASASDESRRWGQEQAWNDFVSSPVIGRGFEPRTEGLGFLAHDIYLQVASATGVLGLTAYLLMLGFLAKQATVRTRHLGLLALPTLVYMFVGPLIPLLWDRFIWCMAALALLVSEYVQPEEDDVGAEGDRPATRALN